MVFVEWVESSLQKYSMIVTLKNERGSLADVLKILAQYDINVISVQLGAPFSEQSNYCKMEIESTAKKSEELIEILEKKIKLVELVSTQDAYNK